MVWLILKFINLISLFWSNQVAEKADADDEDDDVEEKKDDAEDGEKKDEDKAAEKKEKEDPYLPIWNEFGEALKWGCFEDDGKPQQDHEAAPLRDLLLRWKGRPRCSPTWTA